MSVGPVAWHTVGLPPNVCSMVDTLVPGTVGVLKEMVSSLELTGTQRAHTEWLNNAVG